MGNEEKRGNEESISYDTATIASMMQKIQHIVDHYQSRFDSQVTQGHLSLFQMAEVLSHLPEPRLQDFPNQVTQWKRALDQHMDALTTLSHAYEQGVQGIKSIDTEYGQQISTPYHGKQG